MNRPSSSFATVLGALAVILSPLSGCGATGSPLHRALDPVLAEYGDQRISIAYRDLATGETLLVAADEVFHAASTMKVPVMIAVRRQAESGAFALDDPLLVQDTFSSIVAGAPPFTMTSSDDSDAEIYEHLGRSLPIRELERRMIVVSSNLATNLLVDLVGADFVQETAARLGATATSIRRGVMDLAAFDAGISNTTTAGDLLAIMQAIALREAASEATCREMEEVLRAQEFNEGIPAGLPPEYRVAHKTGRITAIHHDAAIIHPTRGGPWILVVMTHGFATPEEGAAVMARVAAALDGARGARP